MPRTFSSISDADLRVNEYEEWNFIRIDFPSPIGTLRFTDRPGGYTGNIDGTSQVWTEADYEHGPLSQTSNQILTVSWIQFANLDYVWTNYVYSTTIRNIDCSLYCGVFNPTTSALKEAYQEYAGTLDEGEFDQNARITIKPHYTPWQFAVPRAKMEGKCINTYRDPMDCQYTGAEPTGQLTCGFTRSDCRLRANEGHINIYDDLPKIDEPMMYGGERHGLPAAPNLGE